MSQMGKEKGHIFEGHQEFNCQNSWGAQSGSHFEWCGFQTLGHNKKYKAPLREQCVNIKN